MKLLTNVLAIVLLILSALYLRSCVQYEQRIQSVAASYTTKIDSFQNELGLLEYRIEAKDQTLENLRIANGRSYYRLKQQLEKRNIKIRDLINRVEFTPAFPGTITVENVFNTDTLYLYLPIDTTINFNDGYLNADLAVVDSSLILDYMYSPGRIHIDLYKQRPGFLKPKTTRASIQFENTNVSLSNTEVVINDKKTKAVLGVGIGYGVTVVNNNIKAAPNIGAFIGIPILQLQK